VRLLAGVLILFGICLNSFGSMNDEKVDFNDISTDLAAFYGFKEIEIVKLDWGIKDLRVADFNGDGRDDIAVANNRKARIDILLQKKDVGPDEAEVAVDPNDLDINVISIPSRFEKLNVPVSQKIYSFVCGDLNSDGRPDLAFYGEPKGLYVLLQEANETEADGSKSLRWHTRKRINIEDSLLTSNALACADLNGDKADDLALAGRDGVYIILQKEDGSLAEPVKYPTTTLTLGVEVGDLNGDGINDLMLITNDNEKLVHVRFGLKTGQLGPQIRFFIEKPLVFELYNLDEKKGDEILTVDAVSKRLICYKCTVEGMDDNNWPILFYPLASGEGSEKRDLAISDFDGDGLVDIVISDPGSAELIFYKQIAGLGLAEPVRFPAFADIVSLSAADIDNDKITELAVLSVKEKVVGISKFEDGRLSFPRPLDLIGEPLAMQLADIDGNGNLDCVYISRDSNDKRALRVIDNVAVIPEKKSPQKAKNRLFGNSRNVVSDETIPVLELDKLTANPDGLKVLDVDQDGLPDVLIFVSYESPILVRQVQKGKFEIIDSPKAQASLIKDASLHSIAVADIDEKPGEELLLAQKNFARSLVFTEGRNWDIVDQYNAKSTENQVSAVAAFNIDGGSETKPAILLLDGQKGRLQILKAGEDKTYRFETELDVGNWDVTAHLKMLFAPLTGGESKCILLFDARKFALIVPPKSGEGQYRLDQQFAYETKIKDGMYGNLAAGDINSDDRPDIIMVDYNRNHIEILALDHDIKPVPAMRFKIFEQKSYRDTKSSTEFDVEPRELCVADVTGDGKKDLVIIIHDRIIIYPQD
jgi:hypothetical protein